MSIDPGYIAMSTYDPLRVNISRLKIIKKIGSHNYRLLQYENGHWKFFVAGKHFPIKAIS